VQRAGVFRLNEDPCLARVSESCKAGPSATSAFFGFESQRSAITEVTSVITEVGQALSGFFLLRLWRPANVTVCKEAAVSPSTTLRKATLAGNAAFGKRLASQEAIIAGT